MLKSKIFSWLLVFSLVLVPMVSDVGQAASLDLKEVSLDGEIDNLLIEVSGARIAFDRDSEKIKVSADLKVRRSGNTLTISSRKRIGWFNPKYTLIIGTARDYSDVNIDVGGAQMEGILKADTITINGGGLDIRADFQAAVVSINSGGLEMRNKVSASALSLNGAGMDIDIDAQGIEDISLNGAGMSARIKYLDSWAGYRNLEVNGIGGDIRLILPSRNNADQDGLLNVEKNGIFDISLEYYEIED